jgi:hypothetical protein
LVQKNVCCKPLQERKTSIKSLPALSQFVTELAPFLGMEPGLGLNVGGGIK